MPAYYDIGIGIFYHDAEGSALLFALEIALDEVKAFLGVKVCERTIRRFVNFRFAIAIDLDGRIEIEVLGSWAAAWRVVDNLIALRV